MDAALLALLGWAAPPGQAAAQALPTRAASTDAAQWIHEAWSIRDGLPVNNLSGLLQDRRGYLWVTTFDGLIRFDGVRFTVFNAASTPGLPSNRIRSLAEGPDGSLWLLTDRGTVVRLEAGRVTGGFGDEPGQQPVRHLLTGAGDGLWLGTAGGLYQVVGESITPVAPAVIQSGATALVRRRDGTLVVGTTGGLFQLRGGAGARLVTGTPLDGGAITALTEDAAGALWVGTPEGVWRERAGRFEALVSPEGPLGAAHALSESPSAGGMLILTATGSWRAGGGRVERLGAEPGGVGFWSDGSSVWHVAGLGVFRDGRRVHTLPVEIPGLGGVAAGELLVDREGSVWIAGSGLHRLKPAIFSTIGAPEGMPGRIVYVVAADRSGNVWVPAPGGVSRIDAASGGVTTFSLGPQANPFFEDDEGTLWLGGGGVWRCALPQMRCRVRWAAELDGSTIHAMHLAPDGTLWVGSSSGLFRVRGDELVRLEARDGAPAATVRGFLATADGALWMATNGGGLGRHEGGRFTAVTTADGLPSNLVRALHEDADGWLWIGTEGRGLARLDPRAWGVAPPAGDRRIEVVDSRHGLHSDGIHHILEDDAGRLWMSSNQGIFWVARSELGSLLAGRVARVHSTAYTERDGLRNREANGGTQPAGSRTPDGRLWFPTQEGVAVVDPARVRRLTPAVPVVVEQVLSRGQPLANDGGRLRVPPDQRDLAIDYTALTYLEPANVRFRYRLDPYDRDWVDAGGRRTAFYTRLPPGTYAFRVQASDGDGKWVEGAEARELYVVARAWETGAFRLLLLALLGALVYLAFRRRVATLRARAEELERIVDERTALLRAQERDLAEQNVRLAGQAEELRSLDRAKARFFANVSHEFRTPLTLTIGPLEHLQVEVRGDPRFERWLDIALRNARRLLSLVNQILDVARLEAGHIRLSPRPLALTPAVEGIVDAFATVAERRGIRLLFEGPADADPVHGAFDADAVEGIVTNLLSNALKFTPASGGVTVSLAREGDGVELRVSDSGAGFTADQLAHVFDRFYRVDEAYARTQPGTGIGLSLVKELVELHGGEVHGESAGPGAGATFVVRLPLKTVQETPPSLPLPLPPPSGAAAEAEILAEPDAADLLAPAPLAALPAMDDTPLILVVDDSAELRAYVRAQLEPGFRVLEAGDGAQGLELARAHLPDIVISDVMMPGTDGHALVRALRADPETDFLPIVLLTAQAEEERRIAGLEGGADHYLTKPFDSRDLRARVRNVIASRRRLRSRLERDGAALPGTVQRSVVPVADPADQEFLDRLRTAIDSRLGDPAFGVQELAAAVFTDRSNLFRRTRKLLGEAPSDLLRRARLERAARLLRDEAGNVGDVAYAVGFNSVSYFCRCFREQYGVTPALFLTGQATTG
jgi:signal transduction histidine kinase/ligand-binding sensor domain-containing protein/CheY-like chemotaxis protein/AraC-like DNA-binding protein